MLKLGTGPASRPTSATRIDVSVPTAAGRGKRPGLRIHRTPTLQADEITKHQGLRVTTPARTLLDLGASLNPRALERALDEAEVKQLYDRTSLDAVARAHPGERDAILARAGYRVLRFSHRQLTREPTMVAHSLRSSA